MRPRRWCLAVVAWALSALMVAGCSGGHKTSGAQPTVPSSSPGSGLSPSPGRSMTFQLADAAAGSVTSVVPDQPLATTPTTVSGVTLQFYVARRLDPNAVLVVFAVVAPNGTDRANVVLALSATGGGTQASVSGVSILDPVGLKQYLPYMANPNQDGTCVCSDTFDSDIGQTSGPTPVYLAAVLAAPPPTVSEVSFVTGLGTIPNVTLIG